MAEMAAHTGSTQTAAQQFLASALKTQPPHTASLDDSKPERPIVFPHLQRRVQLRRQPLLIHAPCTRCRQPCLELRQGATVLPLWQGELQQGWRDDG